MTDLKIRHGIALIRTVDLQKRLLAPSRSTATGYLVDMEPHCYLPVVVGSRLVR